MLETNEATMLTGVFHLHEQEARQVMTPIPAVVTVDIAEDVETALRRCIDERAHAAARDRGREPGPDPRRRPCELALAAAARWGPAAIDRAARARGADRAGDASRSTICSPTYSASARRSRSSSTSTGASPESSRSRTSSRRWSARSPTRPTRSRAMCAAAGRRLVCRAATCRLPTCATTASSCPTTSDAYNSIGGLVFSDLGRLPKRGDTVRVDGYELRVESVRENRIVAVRIRERHPPPGEREPRR